MSIVRMSIPEARMAPMSARPSPPFTLLADTVTPTPWAAPPIACRSMAWSCWGTAVEPSTLPTSNAKTLSTFECLRRGRDSETMAESPSASR